MTDHEIQLLAIGATFGMYLMLAIHIAFGILDGRRDRKAARAAMAQLEAARAQVTGSTVRADLREPSSVRKRADA